MNEGAGTIVNQTRGSASPAALHMKTTFTIEHGQLVLTYRVENRGDVDAYLLNRLYRSLPRFSIDPNLIYIHLRGDTRTVWLHKKIPDIPSDRNVLSPVSPFVTPLRVGQSFEERVAVSLPVHEYREYSIRASTGECRETTFNYVQFSLGYYWSAPGTKEEERDIKGFHVLMPHLPPRSRVQWGVAESEAVHLDVPVIEPQG